LPAPQKAPSAPFEDRKGNDSRRSKSRRRASKFDPRRGNNGVRRTAGMGGERAYSGRLGKGRSHRHSRHSISSAKLASPLEREVPVSPIGTPSNALGSGRYATERLSSTRCRAKKTAKVGINHLTILIQHGWLHIAGAGWSHAGSASSFEIFHHERSVTSPKCVALSKDNRAVRHEERLGNRK